MNRENVAGTLLSVMDRQKEIEKILEFISLVIPTEGEELTWEKRADRLDVSYIGVESQRGSGFTVNASTDPQLVVAILELCRKHYRNRAESNRVVLGLAHEALTRVFKDVPPEI